MNHVVVAGGCGGGGGDDSACVVSIVVVIIAAGVGVDVGGVVVLKFRGECYVLEVKYQWSDFTGCFNLRFEAYVTNFLEKPYLTNFIAEDTYHYTRREEKM
ncbi:Hypothetical predicted protein [Octopus vulgaris]|uniref:Uncharacterized protein n=1 Tax=Octopus vulgaris TaxID=6645 RepID=A0AA36AIE2_OCTVU|nr:Hypothetical predicted protein [Octopus vulgaris]